jgi:hypothetical protein
MSEFSPIAKPTGIPTEVIERPPIQDDLSRWHRLLQEHDVASNALDRAGLLLFNIYTTWSFAAENSISLPNFDAKLEQQYFDVKDSFEKSKKAIRLVQDHELGIRPSGASELDIIEPPQTGDLQGLIIPIAIGIVVLAAAIGTAIWQSSVATKIANEYRKILFDTNQIFCGNPNSDLCNKWNSYKETRKYSQNLKMADSLGETLKKGVKVVAGGLATGLLVAVALVFFLRSR